MKQAKKEMWFDAHNLHTLAMNNTDSEILFVADGYLNGKKISLTIAFTDINFLEFVSHKEINTIKKNLKKRIDKL